MNKENLKKLKKNLPKAWARHISNKVGKSTTWVRKVMRGDAEDAVIMDIAIELAIKKAKEKKSDEDRRIEMINSL